MPVYSEHISFNRFTAQWARCRDAYAGTDAVKGAGKIYLPRMSGWEDVNFIGYQTRALFYPAMSRTVSGLAGIVFGKPPTVSNVPQSFQKEFEDVTLSGVPLFAFGLQLCQEVLVTGRSGVLVDMASDGGRPYWVTYTAEQIINWRTTRKRGKQILTLVVLKEEKEIIDEKDPFFVRHAVQYRVLELVNDKYTVSIYIEKKSAISGEVRSGEWEIDETGVVTPLRRGAALNFIPFVFLGPTGTDPSIEHPPLVDLVDVNLSHYRTSADEEHGAHWSALPTPWVAGLDPSKEYPAMTIGSSKAWNLPQGAQAGMLEFQGAGLKALAEIKEQKRLMMATLGARMLETQKNVQEAAQTVSMRHAGERSALTILADAASRALSICMRTHLFWNGLEETAVEKITLQLNPDAMDTLSSEDVAKLVAAWQAGAISHKTLYFNLSWGEWTRPGVDFEEELEDIEDEKPEEEELEVPLIQKLGPVPPPQPPQPEGRVQ